MSCKLERKRVESGNGNVELSAKSSWVNAGMRDRRTSASTFNGLWKQTTVWRFFHWRMRSETGFSDVEQKSSDIREGLGKRPERFLQPISLLERERKLQHPYLQPYILK